MFSNVEGDGQHESGFSVSLWKQGDRLFGLMSGSGEGRIVGDPPTGILQNVDYAPRLGSLRFTSRTPSGRFEFQGVLEAETLEGTFTERPALRTFRVVLQKDEKWSSEIMQSYESFQAWKTYADHILEFRGPRE